MRTVRLGEVALINPRGDAPASGEQVAFVGMADLDAASASTSARAFAAYGELSPGYRVFRRGDLLAAKITPCWENGKVGEATIDSRFGAGSTEFHVIRPGPRLHGRYALHYLRQSPVRESGTLRMTGSGGQRRVPVSYLLNLPLPVPTIEEQRRLAAILDAADAIRTKRRHILAHMDALTNALFDVMFGGSAFPTEPLGNLASITSGLTKGRRTSAPTTAIPYLAVANVQSGHFRLGQVKTIEATDGEIARFALRDGDLVLTEGGDPDKLGRGAVWRSQIPLCLHQNHIFRVRISRASLQPEYLAAYIASPKARSYFLRAAKQTTGIASINMKQLRGLSVPVPPVDRQAEYVAALDAINTQRARVERALTLDDELFASLQYRAFRGEL